MTDELEELLQPVDDVVTWRLEQLLHAGYPVHVAEELAARPSHEVDLHQAVELAAACGPKLAARIVT